MKRLRFLKTFVVLGMLCSITSFILTLSLITLKNRIDLSAIRKDSRSFDSVHSGRTLTLRPHTDRKQLFENALKLKSVSPKLLACHIAQKPIVFSKLGRENLNQSYRLLIPKWQSKLNQTRDSRHFLSAVVRLRLYKEDKARWTIAELKQWIHYQLWAGAGHIYICNHYLNPDEIIAEDLEKYSNAGLVTVIDWSHIHAVPGSRGYRKQNFENQVGCYNYVKDRWGHLYKWMYSFDMDENPYCPQDPCEGFLPRFLNNLNNGPDYNVGLVLLDNYVLKGQGDRSRDLHYDRINRITPTPMNDNVKVLFRPDWTLNVDMHTVRLAKGRRLKANPKVLKMLHYWGARTQSWGPDTNETIRSTVEFNDVRQTIAVAVRHSLLALGDFDAFNNATGP